MLIYLSGNIGKRIEMCEWKDVYFTDKMLTFLKNLRDDRLLSDVILRSGAYETHAHRIILTKMSEYFTVLFKNEWSLDTTYVTFDANIIPGDSLRSIVDYAYTGQITISEENVLDLIFTVDFLHIQSVKKQCEEFLTNSFEKSNTIFIKENLLKLIWIAHHLNLLDLQSYICNFISNNFFDISQDQTLMLISVPCLKAILENEELTVFENGIPINEIESELLMLVINYISKNELPNNLITELLGTIHLTDIEPEKLSSLIESSPKIQNNELFCQVQFLREMPLNAVENDNYISRKCSKLWQYVDGGLSEIDIEDKICSINVHQLNILTGIAHLERNTEESRDFYITSDDYNGVSSIVGLEFAYKSGKVISCGNISGNAVLPFDYVSCEHFLLSEKDFIKEIVILTECYESGEPLAIKFVTNLDNEFCSSRSAFINSYGNVIPLLPNTPWGYLHSIKNTSTIDNIIPLWVEYRDPNESDDVYSYSDSYSDSDSDSFTGRYYRDDIYDIDNWTDFSSL